MILKYSQLLPRRPLRSSSSYGLRNRVSSTTSETFKIPSRTVILNGLQSDEEYDVLIIGGGATGAGAALDARLRGLKVACVEREDFSCKSDLYLILHYKFLEVDRIHPSTSTETLIINICNRSWYFIKVDKTNLGWQQIPCPGFGITI